ncbi:MAG: putative lipid II flippase FtsW [Clostridia bacterium]|nr:putative lipid II flippase FtsW [Clostridia bacterium]
MKKHAADYWILIFAVGLSAFGIIMIQSSSFYSSMNSSLGAYYYASKQLRSFIVGAFLMVFLWNFDYQNFRTMHLSKVAYVVSILLLIWVLVGGTNAYGAQRWINIAGLSLQPSDVAKVSIVLVLADLFSVDNTRIHRFKFILLAVILAGAFALLIMLQPNLSTTICILAITVAIMFAAGLHWGWLTAAGVAGVGLVVLLMVSAPYRIKRLEAFWNPWLEPLGTGYQLIQSLYAIGAGGFMGVGIGQSMQKMLYIPFAESDFIFAIIAEETGFIGCILLFLAFLILIWRGILVAQRSEDPFASLLATGITSMIAIQTIINLCVVTGAIPPTGIPLPFISYGGTSLMMMLASVGILLNISKSTTLPPKRRQLRFKFSKESSWHNN